MKWVCQPSALDFCPQTCSQVHKVRVQTLEDNLQEAFGCRFRAPGVQHPLLPQMSLTFLFQCIQVVATSF